MLLTGKAYDKCPACSDTIMNAYDRDGVAFIVQALSSPKYLEDLTGLAALHDDTAEVDFEWDEDE
jgi:ubiquitin-like modifier-activating enzyme ATG7